LVTLIKGSGNGNGKCKDLMCDRKADEVSLTRESEMKSEK